MTKSEFVEFMGYPVAWIELNMYCDELFIIQKAEYKKDLKDNTNNNSSYGAGSEHYRYAAFCWWYKKASTRDDFEKLILLARLDPDLPMGKAIIREVLSLPNCPIEAKPA
jgi:hypothetical protein